VTRVRQVIDEIVSVLDSNVDDPRTDRTQRWIFDHFPKYNSKTLPRIGIHRVSTSHPANGIGQGVETRTEADIQITTVVRRKRNRFDIDNDGTAEPEEDVLEYISDQIKTTLEDEHDQLLAVGDDVKHVILQDGTTIRPEGSAIMLDAQTYEVRIGG